MVSASFAEPRHIFPPHRGWKDNTSRTTSVEEVSEMFPLKVTLTTVSSSNNYIQPSLGALNLPRTVCWHMGYGFFHNTHLIYFDVFSHTECKVFFLLLLPMLLADSLCENIFLSRAWDVSFISTCVFFVVFFKLLAPESLILFFRHGLLCDEAKHLLCGPLFQEVQQQQ